MNEPQEGQGRQGSTACDPSMQGDLSRGLLHAVVAESVQIQPLPYMPIGCNVAIPVKREA
jgi:hypothetical protein